MKSFAQFLTEISVSQDMAGSLTNTPSQRRKSVMVHSEDDPSHKIIPLAVHPKAISMFRDLEGRQDAPWSHRAGVGVLDRLMSQPEDGGMLFAMISNSEAESLRSFIETIIRDSQMVMASKAGQSIKDDAVRWVASGEALLRALDRAVRTARGSRT